MAEEQWGHFIIAYIYLAWNKRHISYSFRNLHRTSLREARNFLLLYHKVIWNQKHLSPISVRKLGMETDLPMVKARAKDLAREKGPVMDLEMVLGKVA